MNAYRINEHEVYAGADLDEAIAAAMADSGNRREDTYDPDYGQVLPPETWVAVEDEPGERTTVGELLTAMRGPGAVCTIGLD